LAGERKGKKTGSVHPKGKGTIARIICIPSRVGPNDPEKQCKERSGDQGIKNCGAEEKKENVQSREKTMEKASVSGFQKKTSRRGRKCRKARENIRVCRDMDF